MEEGIEKGIEKGIKKGIEKGIEKGKKEVGLRLMKKAVLSLDEISDMTGLSIETLESLRKKLE